MGSKILYDGKLLITFAFPTGGIALIRPPQGVAGTNIHLRKNIQK